MKLRGPRFDMIGNPVVPGRGSQVGVTIITKDDTTMAKAESNGIYVLNGNRFTIKAGDPLPDGAEFEATQQEPVPEQRANQTERQNKAQAEKPENKSA